MKWRAGNVEPQPSVHADPCRPRKLASFSTETAILPPHLANTNSLQQELSNSAEADFVDTDDTHFYVNGNFGSINSPVFGFGPQEADLLDFTSPSSGRPLDQPAANENASNFNNASLYPSTDQNGLPLYPGMTGHLHFGGVTPVDSSPGFDQSQTNGGVSSFGGQSVDGGFLAWNVLPPNFNNQEDDGYPFANQAMTQMPMYDPVAFHGGSDQLFQGGMQSHQNIPMYSNGLGFPGAYQQPFPGNSLPTNPLPQPGFGSNQIHFQRQPCPSCFESFTRASDLDRHYQSVHLQIKHHCFWPGCHNNRGKGYCRLEKLKTHQREKHGSA
jgi:hypothetical protein